MANAAGSWGEMSFIKKVVTLFLLGGVLAAIVVLYFWTQKPEYNLLFSNLNAEDSGQIIGKLKTTFIPYQLSADSSTIYVPGDKVHEIRLQLAGEGLPQGGGVGFEIFDRTTLGMTEFVQKLNYRRALQGELARTISQLSEVSQARVHLVIPERSLFREDSEKARASVIIKFKPGKSLNQNQIQGIVHLVASGVDNLTPHNITVIDQHGQILSRPEGDSLTEVASNSQLEFQHRIEKEIEKKISSMLEHAVGREKVEVRVSALLDFTQKESTEEKFDPDSVVIRSEQKSQDKSSGATQVSSSVREGLVSLENTADQIGSRSSTPSLAQRQTETTNFEINKIINRTVEPIGKVRRLSVAVLVDGNYKIEGKERKYLAREDAELQKYEEMVKKAMGYSDERSDQVVVTNLPFEIANVVEENFAEEPKSILEKYGILIKYGVFSFITILLIFFGLRPVINLIASGPRREIGSPSMESMSRGAIPAPVGMAGTMAREEFNVAATTVSKQSREELVKTIKGKPDLAAGMIKSWLGEK